ncbi:hypothetical protein PGT21_007833 [Puccinia graminis f. sp. tritici]|uniref:Uncharacterized protein n=1 Tax=Puccinia graminis f. sp. tritici TaxID=56615 RepID=A0A5B0PCX9_PUCGR|nr:hypothetical protein PGT21_007833 [Puccinia graminis f. sp. tritici]
MSQTWEFSRRESRPSDSLLRFGLPAESRPGGDPRKSEVDRGLDRPRGCSQGRSAGPLEREIAFQAVKVRPRTPDRGSVGVALN